MRLSGLGRPILCLALCLGAADAMAHFLLWAKGPCAGTRLRPFLVCIGAEYRDLTRADYLIIGAVTLAVGTAVWYVTGKLRWPRKQGR